MIQLLFSWIISVGQGVISIMAQLVSLISHPTWITQGIQWIMKNFIDDSIDPTGKNFFKETFSHIKHLILHPHPPLTRDVQILILLSILTFCWSAYHPHNRFTWFLEMTPGLIMTIILTGIFYRTSFTRLFYWLFFVQITWMLVGGHYSYPDVPLGEWMKPLFGSERNQYDRMGQFLQGFATAIFTREVLFRTSTLRKGKWLIITSIGLAITVTAISDLIEWVISIIAGTNTMSFLRKSDDIWNMQWSLILALAGSVLSLLILSSLHNRQMSRLVRHINSLPQKKKTAQS